MMPTEQVLHFEAASTLAVVVSSNEPLLFLSADQKIIAASSSFCRAFDIDPAMVAGTALKDLGKGEWGMPKLASLLRVTAAGGARIEDYDIDLQRPNQNTRNLIVHARKLEDGNLEHVRLLLAITDVTDMRAESRLKDALMREKGILLQEVQHRVANSLQIIASVLMQSARRVASDEVRGHLHDAHHRVMSIAALQRQLSVSSSTMVELRAYFAQLSQSLGASMIADPERLSIRVHVDSSSVAADVSISLGLVVTELVINALKHAFPDGQAGIIVIGYQSSGEDWTLSVSDNGVGMNVDGAPKAGLGTGIVEALSRNLGGEIEVTDAQPGTAVTIRHRKDDHIQETLPNAA